MGDSDSISSDEKRDKKRRRRSDTTSDDSSSESSYKRKKKKHRHKDRKKKKKNRSKESSRKSLSRKSVKNDERDVGLRPSSESPPTREESNKEQRQDETQQENLRKQEQARRMAPMSREEYQAQQSTIREVYDEQTGRYRLFRGTGEVIESLVSRSQHETINRQATRGDGASYSRDIFRAAYR